MEDHWGRDLAVNRGHYNFDEIRFDYYRDGVVALEAFRAGLVDLRAESDPGRWATGYRSTALESGVIRLDAFANGRPAGMYAFVFNTRRPIFRDARVRAALAHAFDFEWINKNLFHGAYRRTASFFANSAGLPGADEVRLLEPFRGELPPAVFTRAYRPPGGQ